MMEKHYTPAPGDLVKYLSRTLLVIGSPYAANANWNELWISTIEIDCNTPRKVRCDTLTLIQRAKGENNERLN